MQNDKATSELDGISLLLSWVERWGYGRNAKSWVYDGGELHLL